MSQSERDAAWRPRGNRWLIAVVVTVAAFMEILDSTIVNVSLPHIAGSLSTSYDNATWTLTSYLVANGIVLPISGGIGRIVGRKRYFMICIAAFTLFSFLCGVATQPAAADRLPAVAGVLRRRAAAEPAVDHPRHVPRRPARPRLLRRRGRGDLRADHRADAGRLDHRRLFLALGVPAQRADRAGRAAGDRRPGGGPALGASASARAGSDIDYDRHRPDHARLRRVAGDARPRRGRGLVRLLLHRADGGPRRCSGWSARSSGWGCWRSGRWCGSACSSTATSPSARSPRWRCSASSIPAPC